MIKRILLSLGLSAVLLIGSLVVGAVIVVVASQGQSQYNVGVVRMVDLPVRPMKAFYYLMLPPRPVDYSQTAFDSRKVLGVCFIYIGSVVLYAVPIFGILTFVSRRRKREPLMDPPPPPDHLGS